MSDPLRPEGFLLYERGEMLTPQLLDEMVAGDADFRVTVDHRDVPAPLTELDLVHLRPIPAGAVPRGALVLVADADGFRFLRPAAAPAGRRVARVMAAERAGRLVSLETCHRRVLGAIAARVPAFEEVWQCLSALAVVAGKVVRPFPFPVSFGPPEQLVAATAAKYGQPSERRWQVALARAGLEAWEAEVFGRVLTPGGRVLVLGCGAGREAVALARDGFRVTGADMAPVLVEDARRLSLECGVPATFVAAVAPGLPLGRHAFDAAIVNYGVYEHVPTRARRVRLLRELAGLVTSSGVIVLGVGWTSLRGPRQALVDTVRRALRLLLGARFTTEPGDRLVRHLSLGSDPGTSCFYHAFRDADEIAAEVAEAGLSGDRVDDGPWVLRTPR